MIFNLVEAAQEFLSEIIPESHDEESVIIFHPNQYYATIILYNLSTFILVSCVLLVKIFLLHLVYVCTGRSSCNYSVVISF